MIPYFTVTAQNPDASIVVEARYLDRDTAKALCKVWYPLGYLRVTTEMSHLAVGSSVAPPGLID